MQSWERQQGEGEKIFRAFTLYLTCRSIEKVAKELNKSRNYIRRICSEWNWKERTADFDKSILESTRQELKLKVAERFKKQWEDCALMQEKVIQTFEKRDFEKCSFKSLNEIYFSAAQLQMKILETLKILEDVDGDKNLTINIIPATRKGEMKNV